MSARAALVTGGSGGIGLAVARALGAAGYRLTLSARRPKRLQEAVALLRAEGLEAEDVAADVSKEEDIAALLARHRELHGRLDVLVNSAGAGDVQSIERLRTRSVDKQIAVNLRGVVLCTREALPMLREAGAEHGKALIVNLASVSGKEGVGRISVYGATKAAAIAFTEATRREVGAAGIQCTAVAPGLVDTPMADHARDRVPGEEMVRAEDVGEAVRFLLAVSPRCHVPELVMAPASAPSNRRA